MAQILSSNFNASVASILATEYVLLGADRTVLPKDHPALLYAGSVTGTGSLVLKVPTEGLFGYDALSSGTEGGSVTPSGLTDGDVSVTVALKSKAYQPSDMVKMIDAMHLTDTAVFMLDAVQTGWSQLVNLIANLMGGFATTAGSSGVDASLGDFIDAMTSLNINNAVGPRLCILHPIQWGDILKDLGTVSGGNAPFDPATPGVIRTLARGNGYQGVLLGVDVFTSTQVPTSDAGANRAGGMFARGAVAWGDGLPPIQDPERQMVAGPLLFEWERDALASVTNYVSSMYVGASEVVDTFGCAIKTDA